MRLVRFMALAVLLALPAAAHERGFNYVYSRGTGNSYTMGGSVEQLRKVTRRYSGKYLWVSRNGESYVIRDAATLADVERAFAPLDAIEPELERLHERLEPLEREERKLEEKIDAIEEELDDDDDLPDTRRRRLERELRDLEREMRALEARMRDLEHEERDLDRQHDQREREAERQLWRAIERAISSGAAQKE